MMTTKANITEELRQLLLQPEKQGFTQDTINTHYDEEAVHYEFMYLGMGYQDHIKCAELTEKHALEENKEQCSIFDMGCGTGLTGEALYQKGYRNIVGCDASQGIMRVADLKCDKKAYIQTEEIWLGRPDTFPDEFKNRFDVITATGILAQGHLDSKVFDEMIMACKQDKGGIIVFTTRDMYLQDFGYQTRMDELEAEGKWKKLEEITFDRYFNLNDEVLGRWKKVEIKCFAYQTL